MKTYLYSWLWIIVLCGMLVAQQILVSLDSPTEIEEISTVSLLYSDYEIFPVNTCEIEAVVILQDIRFPCYENPFYHVRIQSEKYSPSGGIATRLRVFGQNHLTFTIWGNIDSFKSSSDGRFIATAERQNILVWKISVTEYIFKHIYFVSLFLYFITLALHPKKSALIGIVLGICFRGVGETLMAERIFLLAISVIAVKTFWKIRSIKNITINPTTHLVLLIGAIILFVLAYTDYDERRDLSLQIAWASNPYAMSSDGHLFAAINRENQLAIWQIGDDSTHHVELDAIFGDEELQSLFFSEDNQYLLAISDDNESYIWLLE